MRYASIHAVGPQLLGPTRKYLSIGVKGASAITQYSATTALE